MGMVVSDSRLAILYVEFRHKIYLTTVDITTKTVHEFEFKVKEGSLELEDENLK